MSAFNLNILLLLGLILFLGTAGEGLLRRTKLPRIAAYFLVGVLIGQPGLGIIDAEALEVLRPLNYFALALVGFMIGGELRRDVFQKWGKSLLKMLFLEGFGAFSLVFVLTAGAGFLIFRDAGTALALALLLGAVSTATDPASPADVIRETRSKGPLSTNILGVVALDDGLAVALFAFVSSIAGRITGFSHGGGGLAFTPALEITGSAGLGAAAGAVMARILDRQVSREASAGAAFGLLLIVAGGALAAGFDLILAVMCFGVALANLRPERSKHVFEFAGSAVPPVFVFFFVTAGASLNPGRMSWPLCALALLYIAGSAGGKIAGARAGAAISGAPASVYKYLPFCLMAQAGVAAGLAILAAQNFPGPVGDTVLAVVVSSVFLLQIAGPVITRISLEKAGEAGLNVTEEDLLESIRVRELCPGRPRLIYEDTTLAEILKVFSEDESLYYPVVSDDGAISGIVSVEGIKYSITEQELGGMIIALDIMEPVPAVVSEEESLARASDVMEKHGIDYVPVSGAGGELRGLIEKRALRRHVSRAMLEMRMRIESFEKKGKHGVR